MSAEVMEQIVREIEALKAEQTRLAALRPLFTVINQAAAEDITANQNNYALGNYDLILLNPTAARTINGITGGVTGRLLFLKNASSSFTLTFTHQNASATAENRIVTGSGGNIVLGVRQTAIFAYVNDAIFVGATRWLLLIPGA